MRVSSLEEYIDQILQANDKLPVINEALQYYDTVELWCLHAETTGDHGPGLAHTRLNLAKSHIFWNRFVAPSATLYEFLARLEEPHIEVEETYNLFCQLHAKTEEMRIKARKSVQINKDRVGDRARWELRILTPHPETWLEYIESETNEELAQALFNRAVTAFPNEPRIWHRWIQSSWDRAAPALADRACALCRHPSLETTRVLLGTGSITSSESKIAALCRLLSQAYTDPAKVEELKAEATRYVKQSRDAEFIGLVQSMLLMVDKELASSLWVLKGDAMYREWLQWKRLAMLDISEYFEPILGLTERNSAVLSEQLRGYLMLGMTLEVDVTLMRIRELSHSTETEENANRSEPPVRNREQTSLIITGNVSKDAIYAELDAKSIVSSQHSAGYHLVEMVTPQAKKVALATLMFSKKLELKCYDAAETTLWVTNYDPSWGKPELEAEFARYGQVLAVRLPTTSGRRFCYVQMSSAQEALAALEGVVASHPGLVAKLSDPSARSARGGAVEEGRQVYVNGLDYAATRPQLQAWVSSHSLFPVKSVQIPNSRHGREHDGYAFVEYGSSEQAREACTHFNTLDHAGRAVRASISHKKRRLENPHIVVVENVWDVAGLKRLVEGRVEYNEATKVAEVQLESPQQVGRTILELQGRELAGELLRAREGARALVPARARARAARVSHHNRLE